MRRGFWTRATVVAWVLLIAAIGPAAAVDAEPRLDSNPRGLFLEVRGPVTISGTGALPMGDLPEGRYRLTVDGAGYPETHALLHRGSGDRISLTSDNGPDAFLLPPGFAHFRRGERGRGLVFLGTGLALAGGALVQELSRGDAVNDLSRAQRQYDSAETTRDVEDAREALLRAESRASDEAEMRDLWTGAAGAVWVGAALEAWLLTPKPTMTAGTGGRYVLSADKASGMAAGFRSLLVPGAGQRYMGRRSRGNRFTAGVALLGSTALLVHDAYLDKRRDQEAAQRLYNLADTDREIEERRAALESAADDAATLNDIQWAAVGLAGALYLWNILDAVQLVESDVTAAGLSWRVAPGRDGLRAWLSWRIG